LLGLFVELQVGKLERKRFMICFYILFYIVSISNWFLLLFSAANLHKNLDMAAIKK